MHPQHCLCKKGTERVDVFIVVYLLPIIFPQNTGCGCDVRVSLRYRAKLALAL